MLIEAAKGGHTAVACLIMEQPLHPARASKHRVTKKGNVTTVASEINSVGVQQPRKPKKSVCDCCNDGGFILLCNFLIYVDFI